MFFTSGVDFISARQIAKRASEGAGKRWLVASVLINLLTLGFFKYYNFFADSFSELVSLFGFHPSFVTLKIILPVGISFYTFQSIAYVTDVYRKKIRPETSALYYFAFICFFPQMVAGPIERAKWLLPQFKKEKQFNTAYFESGINLVLYGFFKKIVIADNLALIVDDVHNNMDQVGSWTLLLGVFAFAIQIYADFSGYSDIARGCVQMLGFRLSKNFYFPYFSSSLKQFWKRWHISLSSWFRDYVYISLGGNHTTKRRRNFNYLLTFVISGFWHGASFTFILWGFFHGLLLIVEKTFGKIRRPEWLSTLTVFLVVSFLFTLFRSASVSHFIHYVKFLVDPRGIVDTGFSHLIEGGVYFVLPLLLFLFLELSKYHKKGMSVYKYNLPANLLILVCIILFSVFENAPRFIYFQF
ncbi:MAG: MBOAT family O-acyltransferase [Bacteroidota bacterium]